MVHTGLVVPSSSWSLRSPAVISTAPAIHLSRMSWVSCHQQLLEAERALDVDAWRTAMSTEVSMTTQKRREGELEREQQSTIS